MKFRPCLRLLILATVFAAAGVVAQPVYRQVDAEGRVSFSDRPAEAASAPIAHEHAAIGADATLPYELRRIAQRYPVTLYTQSDCEPCAAGRALLAMRGIPFSERTVTTAEDAAALQQLSGQKELPLLTIGTQQLHGFSDAEWTRYLDAAGYPKQSKLPPGYQAHAPMPLVAPRAATPAAPSAASTLSSTPMTTSPSGPTPDNPAGIRF